MHLVGKHISARVLFNVTSMCVDLPLEILYIPCYFKNLFASGRFHTPATPSPAFNMATHTNKLDETDEEAIPMRSTFTNCSLGDNLVSFITFLSISRHLRIG
jgi:hypothetical protein